MPVIRIIFLLAPVFVSLFWAVALSGDKKQECAPRLFLSKVMILAGLVFTAHFVYFAPLPDVYVFFDIPLQWVGLAIFPLYHIYFRLLTVDEKFSFRKHTRYFIFPLSIALIYSVAVMFTPVNDYKLWLYNSPDAHPGEVVRFLNIMRPVLKITFALTLIVSMIGNYRLMRKYGHKAQQFYSDIQDAKQRNAKRLMNSILAVGIVSLVIVVAGRVFLMPKDWLIYAGWMLFAILLFVMGDSGIKQKIVNPSFEPTGNLDTKEEQHIEISVNERSELLRRIMREFTNKKIYLNSELTILDLGKKTGTNRTYISTIINQQYNLNFCSFVNGFRIEELERVLLANPEFNNEEFAQHCGFGSVSSMKRAVYTKTGESLKDFKKGVYSESKSPAYST